jgi:hypothetical protein
MQGSQHAGFYLRGLPDLMTIVSFLLAPQKKPLDTFASFYYHIIT